MPTDRGPRDARLRAQTLRARTDGRYVVLRAVDAVSYRQVCWSLANGGGAGARLNVAGYLTDAVGLVWSQQATDRDLLGTRLFSYAESAS